MNKHITKLYETAGNAGSFGGIQPVKDKLKKTNKNPSKSTIASALSNLDSYTLHKQKKRPRTFNPVYVYKESDLLQIDLIDIQQLAKYNDNVKYLLCAINTFTRFAEVRPLLNKTTDAVIVQFNDILNSMNIKYEKCGSDRGKEFLSKKFIDNLHAKGIKHVKL